MARNRRHQLYNSGQLRPRAARRDEVSARSLADWERLARRSPNAVPYAVQKTLVNRGKFDASHFKGV